MARAKDIAALAGLAGLAYAMRKKGDKDDAGDQKTSAYATRSNMTPIKGVGDATNDVATNKSAYATRSNMTPMQGVGDAKNDPLVKPKPAPKPAVAADEPAGSTTPLSSAVKREAKTSKAAQADFPEMERTFTIDGKPDVENQKRYDAITKKSGAITPSALKTDALKVASRAAAAADRQRKMAKQSSYKSGGMTASSRADGCATKGKTRGKIC